MSEGSGSLDRRAAEAVFPHSWGKGLRQEGPKTVEDARDNGEEESVGEAVGASGMRACLAFRR